MFPCGLSSSHASTTDVARYRSREKAAVALMRAPRQNCDAESLSNSCPQAKAKCVHFYAFAFAILLNENTDRPGRHGGQDSSCSRRHRGAQRFAPADRRRYSARRMSSGSCRAASSSPMKARLPAHGGRLSKKPAIAFACANSWAQSPTARGPPEGRTVLAHAGGSQSQP